MENEKKKSKLLPILIILVGLGLVGYGLLPFLDGKSDDSSGGSSGVSTAKGTLLEDVEVTGYMGFGDDYTFFIEKDGTEMQFKLGVDAKDLFTNLNDYNEYIKLNIYYTEDGETKTITDYEIFNKDNNEKIENVKTITELLPKIGLYYLGTYTEDFTLKDSGRPGTYYVGDQLSYTYYMFVFTNKSGRDIEFKYIVKDNEPFNQSFFVPGSAYSITFEVKEGFMNEYEYVINEIKLK